MNKTVQKIRVTPEMIINDMGLEYPQNFFCEFDTEGDPLNGIEGEAPKIHPRKDGWWIGKTNLSFTVELDGIYRITNLYFYPVSLPARIIFQLPKRHYPPAVPAVPVVPADSAGSADFSDFAVPAAVAAADFRSVPVGSVVEFVSAVQAVPGFSFPEFQHLSFPEASADNYLLPR